MNAKKQIGHLIREGRLLDAIKLHIAKNKSTVADATAACNHLKAKLQELGLLLSSS